MKKSFVQQSVTLYLSVFSSSVLAAPTLPELLPNIPRPILRETPTLPANPIQLPEAVPDTQRLPKVKITVSHFIFSGNKQFSEQRLNQELVEFTGKQIGVKELNLALRKLQSLYRKQGFLLAQAYLPVQDLKKSNGESVEIEVGILEGQLGQVKVDAPEGMDLPFLQSLGSYHMQPGDVIYEKNLIRNLMTINDLPGLSMFSQLNPGEAVGSSDVAISIEPKPKTTYLLFANTFGNRFTGREQVGAAVTMNNLAGRGDQLSVVARSSINDHQRSLSGFYVTPIHDSGTLLSLNYAYVDYRLGKEFAALNARGDAHYISAYIDQPWCRDLRKSLFWRAGANYKIIDDEVRASGVNNRRDVSSVEFGLNGDWVNESNDVIYQWSATITQGYVSIKDGLTEQLDALGLDTQGSFTKYNWTSTRSQYFENGLNLVVRADYQHAENNLDIVEKFAVGAINRWRQFAELPNLADQGYMLGVDLKKTWIVSSQNASQIVRSITPFVFYDYGQGKLNHRALTTDNRVKSSHIGIGLDFSFVNQWNMSVSLSDQVRDLEGAPKDRDGQLWAQLRKEF